MGPGARLIGGLLVVAALAAGSAQAATFGHARLASSAGEPLLILVPVSDLTTADLRALSARPAPAADWTRAGLTPPVGLDSLNVTVVPDVQAGARRVLRIHSPQAFSGALADLLLDVHTATGEQRYQVSLVAPGPVRAEPPAASASGAGQAARPAPALGAAAAHTSTRRVPAGAIAVRPGDTMFSIARRHAVDGVSIYQLMMALQRANPQAFIHDNINLVRAGASLAVPEVADMLSISDAEARRQFVMQTAAFDRLRGRLASGAARMQAKASGGSVSRGSTKDRVADSAAGGDRLQLSQGGKTDAADARAARGHALNDAESRVGQLQDNVQNLNKALQAQGEAASHAAVNGAHAIGRSIDQIASAISEASREAAAQANAQTAAGAQAAGQQAGADAPGAGVQGRAAGSGASPSGSAVQGASDAASTDSPGTPGAKGSASSPGQPAGEGLAGAAADLAPVPAPSASASAEALEQKASKRAEHRVSWIQDHLLGVMTALLAVIVFIIAWLLRRANTTRDDSEDSPRVTEAMVREKLQDIDLELPAQDAAVQTQAKP